MGALLDFARGPLFRLTFAIMVLGLARLLFLDIIGMYRAYRRTTDKKMPWKLIFSRSFEWFFPVKRVIRERHVYSLLSIVFHIGLIIVPLFFFAHVNLWKEAVGISWPALPYSWAFWLTICTIASALFLLISRLTVKAMRALSLGRDYLWLLLLLVPFVTGFICANVDVGPGSYQVLMLVHVLSAELIFVLIPFSKIAHCVLAPLSQVVCALAWKFPPETDDDICTTLNKKGAPV